MQNTWLCPKSSVSLDEKICENCAVWIHYLVRGSGAFQIWRNSKRARSRYRFGHFRFSHSRFGHFRLSGRQVGHLGRSDLGVSDRWVGYRFRTTWPLWEVILITKVKRIAAFTPMTLSIRLTYSRVNKGLRIFEKFSKLLKNLNSPSIQKKLSALEC